MFKTGDAIAMSVWKGVSEPVAEVRDNKTPRWAGDHFDDEIWEGLVEIEFDRRDDDHTP